MKPLFPILFFLTSLLNGQVNQENHSVPIVLTHVAVIDMNRASVEQDMTVVIAGNRLADIGKAGQMKVANSAICRNQIFQQIPRSMLTGGSVKPQSFACEQPYSNGHEEANR